MRYSQIFLLSSVAITLLSSDAVAVQKGTASNAARERKDNAKVQNERQDINEAEEKIQADLFFTRQEMMLD